MEDRNTTLIPVDDSNEVLERLDTIVGIIDLFALISFWIEAYGIYPN